MNFHGRSCIISQRSIATVNRTNNAIHATRRDAIGDGRPARGTIAGIPAASSVRSRFGVRAKRSSSEVFISCSREWLSRDEEEMRRR